MVPNNSLLSERIAFLGFLVPVTPSAVTVVASSPYFSVLATNGNLFQRYFAAVQLGASSGTNTATISLYKASDTSGTGSATVVANVTYLGTASGVQTNTASILLSGFDINGTAFDTAKPFVSLQVSGVVSGVSGFIIGSDGRYDPATSYNIGGQVAITNAV